MAESVFISKKTVLCVDDNERGLLIRKEMLEVFGFAVDLAPSGKAALKLLREKKKQHSRFDAVIVDYQMPEMDGAELVDHIKRLYPGTPVVMLTGYHDAISERTRRIVDGMVLKGEPPDKLLSALFRVTGAERRRAQVSTEQLHRRNTDHIHAVQRYLREDMHRKH
jgi:CheY-like chemotaxis protein